MTSPVVLVMPTFMAAVMPLAVSLTMPLVMVMDHHLTGRLNVYDPLGRSAVDDNMPDRRSMVYHHMPDERAMSDYVYLFVPRLNHVLFDNGHFLGRPFFDDGGFFISVAIVVIVVIVAIMLFDNGFPPLYYLLNHYRPGMAPGLSHRDMPVGEAYRYLGMAVIACLRGKR